MNIYIYIYIYTVYIYIYIHTSIYIYIYLDHPLVCLFPHLRISIRDDGFLGFPRVMKIYMRAYSSLLQEALCEGDS